MSGDYPELSARLKAASLNISAFDYLDFSSESFQRQ